MLNLFTLSGVGSRRYVHHMKFYYVCLLACFSHLGPALRPQHDAFYTTGYAELTRRGMSGSGFQYGDHAVAALAQTPEGAFVAHLVVGFDGGVNGMIYSKTSSYPVHVQCGNSTSGSRHNATFLVFFPFPKAPSRQIRKSKKWRAVQMDVKQQVCKQRALRRRCTVVAR